MPAAAFYRAIGVLVDKSSGIPTHTSDFASLDDAIDAGERLLAEKKWAEFYVKTIYRHPRHVRSELPPEGRDESGAGSFSPRPSPRSS